MSHFFLKKKSCTLLSRATYSLLHTSFLIASITLHLYSLIFWKYCFKIQDFYFLTLTRCNQSIIHHPSANIFSLSWAALDAEVKSQYSPFLKQTWAPWQQKLSLLLSIYPLRKRVQYRVQQWQFVTHGHGYLQTSERVLNYIWVEWT